MQECQPGGPIESSKEERRHFGGQRYPRVEERRRLRCKQKGGGAPRRQKSVAKLKTIHEGGPSNVLQ